MQYAKYYDRKNSGSRITHRMRLDVLIDEPCVKTYEGKCVNNAELFLRARCTCLECDACEATSGCSWSELPASPIGGMHYGSSKEEACSEEETRAQDRA